METGRRNSANIWDWPLQNEDMVPIHNDANGFEADLQVPTFKASEISVKVINDELVVHCYQDQGNGRTPREVHRTYVLPPDVDMKSVKSTVKNNGVLQIVASKKK